MLIADRAEHLTPYVFSVLDRKIAEVERSGRRVINLGISDPNQATRPEIIDKLCQAAAERRSHRYPPLGGLPELKKAVARWYWERFNVRLDPEHEVLITAGSKEALVHLALAVVNPNGLVLVPDPGYPAYRMPHALFGFAEREVPLRPEHGFLPVISSVHAGDLERAELLYVNYPNNPTGAVADRAFWRELVREAARWDFVICSDLAYADIVYQGRATSVLEIPEARGLAVESVTFSKSYNMQGFRLSAMVGSSAILDAFSRIEGQINAGVYLPVQAAGIEALRLGPDPVVLETYRERRQILGQGLSDHGLEFAWPDGAVYFWVRVPGEESGDRYADRLLNEAGIAVTPGSAFGPEGTQYIRVSFTVPLDQIVTALGSWPRVETLKS